MAHSHEPMHSWSPIITPFPLVTICANLTRNLILAGAVWATHTADMEVDLAWDDSIVEEPTAVVLSNVDVYMIVDGDEVTLDFDVAVDNNLDRHLRAVADRDGRVTRVYAINIPNAVAMEPAMLEVDLEACNNCPALGTVQAMYGDLTEQGCDKEAEELIDQILAQRIANTDAEGSIEEAVHFEWKDAKGPKHHRVGYQPDSLVDPNVAVTGYTEEQDAEFPTKWSLASNGKVSFHFQGATIQEVVDFFQHATGMRVTVRLPESGAYYAPAGIHVLCRDKSVEQGLRVVLGSCGLAYIVRGDEIIVTAPEHADKLAVGASSVWKP